MCGLAGVVGPDAGAAQRHVSAMLPALRHRGPDGEGILARDGGPGRNAVVLGHRRLSIIDLTPAAGQPMTSSDGRYHVILNGEIYNYLELRRELEASGRRFRTRSDTEVLLEAWAAWGAKALDRVIGMFAFALLDEAKGTLVLARDPFAIKPLYYTTAGGQLAFASEIPPLLELPGVSRRADANALADFLTRGVNNHEGHTMFADVRDLPGAHYAEVSLERPLVVEPRRYWAPPTHQTLDLSFEQAAQRLREELEESVRIHLRSDVPVGLLLSGGQDSSSVLALARKALGDQAPIATFSFRGDDGATDEGAWIEAARSAAGAEGHDVRVSAAEWAAELPVLVASQGEPFGSPVIYAQRRLFARAAEAGMKVVLEGQGADEFLAGYDRFHAGRLASLLRANRPIAFARTARGYSASRAGWRPVKEAIALCWPGLRSLRRQAGAGSPTIEASWLSQSGAALSPAWQPRERDILRGMLASSLRAPSIPWLMRYSDRNAMAYSIENRLPFLNRRVVDFALGLPESHFIASDGLGKHLLRSAMRGVVPDVIRERRDRIGFDVPAESWLRKAPGVVELLNGAGEIPAVRRDRAAAIRTAVQDGQAMPRAQVAEAWKLVTLSAWSRAFGVTYS